MSDKQENFAKPGRAFGQSPIWMYTTVALVVIIILGISLSRLGIGPWSKSAAEEYNDKTYDFSLRYPSGWTKLSDEELAKLREVFVFAVRRSNPNGFFAVRVLPGKAKDVQLEGVARALDKTMPRSLRGFNKLAQDSIKIDGTEALRLEYTFVSRRKLKIREQLVIILRPGKVYYLVAWGADRNFERLRADFEKMTESLTLK